MPSCSAERARSATITRRSKGVEDVCSGRVVRDRGVVIQKKTGRPVQFEITEVTRQSVERLLASQPSADGYLFRSRTRGRAHISARQYARIVHRWIRNIGLDDRGLPRAVPQLCAALSVSGAAGDGRHFSAGLGRDLVAEERPPSWPTSHCRSGRASRRSSTIASSSWLRARCSGKPTRRRSFAPLSTLAPKRFWARYSITEAPGGLGRSRSEA